MRQYLLLLLLSFCSLAKAQTFTATGGAIPGISTARTCFTNTVSGIGVIGVSYGLSQVCLTLTHPNDDELEIVLIAPDGTIVPLTVQNGGSGNNYTNTCFTATASSSIKFGSAPFTGTFLPEGHLGAVNNGQNANGNWQLCIQDRRSSGNAGSLVNWSLTFSNTPAPAPPALPACKVTLPATSSCSTASLVCDFNGLCGTTNGTSVQDWPGSGLNACFGLQNNSFIKFIASATTASFSVWVPSTFTGGYNTAGIQMIFFSGTCNAGPVTTYGCYPHIFPSGNPANPLITLVSAAGLTPGNTYYLMIDGFNNDNCSFTIAANTGVNILNISPTDPSICLGASVNLTATGGNGVFSWSPSTNLNTTSGSTVTASPSISTIYTVTSSSTGGCPITKDVSVTVSPVPTAPILSVANSCGAATLTVSGTTGTLTWSDGGSGNPRTVTGAGSFSVTQTIGGCSSAASNTVSAAPLPLPATPVLSVINSCQSSILTVTGTTGTLTWSDGGTGNPRTFATAGNYFVTQTIGGCTSLASNTVSTAPVAKPATPVLSVVNDCGVSRLTVTGTSGTLTWSDGGTSNPRAVSTAGNISVIQTINGCNSDASNIVATAPLPVPPSPTLTLASGCGFASATATGFTGTLVWNNGSTLNPIVVTTPGEVFALQTVGGCTSAIGNSAYLVPGIKPPTPTFSIVQPGCTNTSGSITVTAPTGYEYSLGGITYQPSATFTGLMPGDYSLTARRSTSYCASDAATFTIDAALVRPAPPTAQVTAAPTCSIPTGTITITAPLGINFEYSLNGIVFQRSPLFTGLAAGDYDVVTKNLSSGCASQPTRLKVPLLDVRLCGDDIYFPSAFTPNADGNNDDFGPGPVSNLAGITAYSLEVFNRLGEKIFSTTDPFKKWDGRYQGKMLANFSYVWQASYKNVAGAKKFKKGSVMIVL